MSANDGNSVERRGIADAFVENAKFLRRYVRQFVNSHQEAEDVAQEAFVRAFVAEKKTRIEQPKAFLFQVARNVALTELKKKSRQIYQCIDDLSESELGMVGRSEDDQMETMELLDTYREVVSALPPKCRNVFILRKVYGFKHREIAEKMGISVSSVEKYVRQGILACQDRLASRRKSDTRGHCDGGVSAIPDRATK